MDEVDVLCHPFDWSEALENCSSSFLSTFCNGVLNSHPNLKKFSVLHPHEDQSNRY